jgi:hypothetical protein
VAVLAILLIALYNVQADELIGDRAALVAQRRRRTAIAWGLAIPAIVERIVMMTTRSPRLYLAGAVCWLAFLAFVTWAELRSVLRQREVTSETISMAISVYLLLGFTWGLAYVLIFLLDPQAFAFDESFPTGLSDRADAAQVVAPIFLYFSLTTLATIGFGDITPVSLQARYTAVAEGITGQFYLAILVARLVSMQIRNGRKT